MKTRTKEEIIRTIDRLIDYAHINYRTASEEWEAVKREDAFVESVSREEWKVASERYAEASERAFNAAQRLRRIARKAGVYDEIGETGFRYAYYC